MATIALIPKDIEAVLRGFRMSSPPTILYVDRKSSSTPTVKLDTNVLDEDEDFSIEALAANLPTAPRVIVLPYKPKGEDFPKIILIDWIPNGCETGSSMLHVGTLPAIERLARNPKVIQITDADELTEETLNAKLRRF